MPSYSRQQRRHHHHVHFLAGAGGGAGIELDPPQDYLRVVDDRDHRSCSGGEVALYTQL
jgi:hypothetical protein